MNLKKCFWEKNKCNFFWVVLSAFFGAVCSVLAAEVLRQFTNMLFQGDRNLAVQVLVKICLVALAKHLALYFSYRTAGRFKKKAMLQYKRAVYQRIMFQSAEDISRNNVSDYLSLFGNDLPVIETDYVSGCVNLIDLIFSFVIASAAIIYYSPQVYVVVIACSALALLVSKMSGKKMAKMERQVSDCNSKYLALIKDIFSGFRVVKSYQVTGALNGSYEGRNENVVEWKRKRMVARGSLDVATSVILSLINISIFLVCGIAALQGRLTDGGVALALIQLVGNVSGPIQMVGSKLALKKSAESLIVKAENMLDTKKPKADRKEAVSFEKEIALDHVSVRFGEQEVLKDLTYTFEKNKKYLLTGESGSGKTTIFNVLQKFLTDYQGNVTVDGRDLGALEEEDLYPVFAYGSQDVFIFNDTVENNITLFEEYPKEELEQAIRFAMLEDFVGEKSLEFSCGENGQNLSGGEKQRIALARCILRKKPVLLLDEITSALDPDTARQIESNILHIEGITVISICHHRITGIHDKYDAILHLADGQAQQREILIS